MTWNQTLVIGIPEIDRQHKELCDQVDKLYAASSEGKGQEEALKTLEFLERYTVEHFAQEEAFQQKIGYPKYIQHKELHDQFIQKITQLKEEMLKTGVTLPMMIQINHTISGWLINHIMRVDTDLKNYVK